ncbi:MAG TPA: adenylate/guanylate cyclase domain-containing protein, partial [Actinomycetota bacterium]|nr:adenylate/guanylate cyclase domain-containing protein [Actinomycetota bacterium]
LMLRVRIERQRCVGAGTCITLAPTAFSWLKGEFAKADVVDTDTVDEELLREAAFSCPTQAIIIEEVEELLPWQLRGSASKTSKRVMATFMFTDIVKSTNLIEAIGDEAWESVLRWHNEALRSLFNAHRGEEIDNPGDGFFVSFESPEAALACAVAIQRKLTEHRQTSGFAPQVRIGLHASSASVVGKNLAGKGVHEAARISAQANGGEIIASVETTAGTAYTVTQPRTLTLKGITEPVDTVLVEWK